MPVEPIAVHYPPMTPDTTIAPQGAVTAPDVATTGTQRLRLVDGKWRLLLIGVLILCLVVSFLEQLQLTAASDGLPLPFLGLMVLGLLVGSGLVVGFGSPSAAVPWPGFPVRSRLPHAAATLATAAVLSAGTSAWLVYEHGSPALATTTWICGIILALIAAAWPRGRRGTQAQARHTARRARWAVPALAGILVVAALLRLPALDSIPGFIHGDEGNVGLSSRMAASGEMASIFSTGFMGLPMLGYSWDGLFLRVLGDNLFSLRASSAFLGLGSILFTALLGKELFNWRTSLLAAILLSFYHVHIHYSRDGLHNIQALFMVVLTVYLLVLALRYCSATAAVCTGIALSIDLQVFFSARLAYIMVPLILVYALLVVDRGQLRPRLPMLAWLTLGFMVATGPVAAFIARDLTTFSSHSSDALVFSSNPASRDHMFSGYGTYDIWQVMRVNIWRALQTFNSPGHVADQYPFLPHPMLDPVSGALLPSAMVLGLYRLRHVGYGVCMIIFGVIMLCIGTFTLDQPDWNRLLVVVPVVALLIGALLDTLWNALERSSLRLRAPAALACLGLLVAVFYGNYQWYFVQFQPAVRHSFSAFAMDAGNYLRQHNSSYAYAIQGGGFDFGHQAVLFLAPNAHTCTIPPTLAITGCLQASQATSERLFFIMPSQLALIPALEKSHPGGSLALFNTYDTNARVMLYRVTI
ncbi:MAG: glycosyl transferase, family 39 [Chloroflexi bacterium]|nr:glycosyl transferase, family 39 [Chloroflexota bacterium]